MKTNNGLKILYLLLLILSMFCSSEIEEQKVFPLTLVYTLQGSTIISNIKLINSSDSTAYFINLFRNTNPEPFITVDSINAHTIKEISRYQYKPVITLADKIILQYKYNTSSFKDVFYLARYIHMDGEWSKN